MSIKSALAGGGAVLAAGAFILGNFTGEQAEPVDTIGLSGGETIVTAADICAFPETEVFLVTTLGGEQRYEAKYDSPEVRYDLTWQVDGSVVAVEELRGAAFEVRPEQIDLAMWDACVTNKNVIPIEVGE